MKYVIVGGNIIGMIAALRLKDEKPSSEVILVEPGKAIGANMRTTEFQGQIFDQGMQNWYDTGIDWVDNYVRDALEHAQIEYTAQLWPFHDNSGIHFNNSIQYNSPYLNVSHFPEIEQIKKTVFKNARQQVVDKGMTFREYLINRFGFSENNQQVSELIRRYNSPDNQEQSSCFSYMLPMDRVLIDSVTEKEIALLPRLREYVATPHKHDVPAGRNSRKFTIYPTRGGISKLVDAFKSLLESKNIIIKTSCEVKYQNVKNSIQIIHNNEELKCDHIIWGANLNFFQKYTFSEYKNKEMGLKKLGSSVVHVCTEQVITNKNLIYLFDLCKTPFNRITFYGELTKQERDYNRATFELIRTPENYKDQIKKFLYSNDFISSGAIHCSDATSLPWPPYFPIGYEDSQAQLSEFAKSVNNIDTLIASDASRSSVLMFPTAGRVFRESYWS